MGKGIRELAMSPDEPEKEEQGDLFKPYPSQYGHDYNPRGYDSDRYDGNYDSDKYKKNEEAMDKEDEKRAKLITISLIITRKDMGPKFNMDAENYEYMGEEDECTAAKMIAYDRIKAMLGKGFESRYAFESFEVDYGYGEFDATAILRPIEYLP